MYRHSSMDGKDIDQLGSYSCKCPICTRMLITMAYILMARCVEKIVDIV